LNIVHRDDISSVNGVQQKMNVVHDRTWSHGYQERREEGFPQSEVDRDRHLAKALVFPQRMLAAGLNVTVNTDDPSVSRITLSNEYQHVCEELKVSMDALKQSVLRAAQKYRLRVSWKT
jgi:hypothetical protein